MSRVVCVLVVPSPAVATQPLDDESTAHLAIEIPTHIHFQNT